MQDCIIIGKIVGVHGVKGTVKIHSYAESLEIFEPGASIALCHPDGSEADFEIDWIKPHSRGALMALKNVNHRDQAKALVGADLRIDKTKLPELEAGVYYWYDLIGLKVFTTENRYLGHLESIIETGANDVYVIKNEDREVLVPGLDSIVHLIDIDSGIMRVELPDGLEE
jgi:16S rRNA processing protein RimM